MPPWSSLLSGSSSHNNASGSANTTPTRGNSSTPTGPRDRPSPLQPLDYLDPPPTLNHDHHISSPARPRVGGTRQHSHNRSLSQPLPKLFGRAKSNGDVNFNNADGPLDEDMMPVADELNVRPTRAISGKKENMDEQDKTTRRCMCCDSRVKVPKELHKFRCLCCLTINDLKPVEEQSKTDKDRAQPMRTDALPASLLPVGRLPLSVDYTQSLIRQCLKTYLTLLSTQNEVAPSDLYTSPSTEGYFDGIASRSPGPGTPQEQRSMVLQASPIAVSPPEKLRSPNTAPLMNGTSPKLPPSNSISGTQTRSLPQGQRERYQNGSVSSAGRSQPTGSTPVIPARKPPPPPAGVTTFQTSQYLGPQRGHISDGSQPSWTQPAPQPSTAEAKQRQRYERIKRIFRPLEDYMVASFGEVDCLNRSFSTVRPSLTGRAHSESNIATPASGPVSGYQNSTVNGLSELDAKTLLLGDIGENGSWWTGKLSKLDKSVKRKQVGEGPKRGVSSKSPNIDWSELGKWYTSIHTAGKDWRTVAERIKLEEPSLNILSFDETQNVEEVEIDLAEARDHAVRTLLKITENMLKRPTRPIKEPEDLRFLLILLYNPSLYPSSRSSRNALIDSKVVGRSTSGKQAGKAQAHPPQLSPRKSPGREGNEHNGLLKRIFGLIAYSTDTCHRCFVYWLSRFEKAHFTRTVDLVASFVTHRIARRSGRPRRQSGVDDGGLIPDFSGGAMNTSQQLHSAMGLSGSMKKSNVDVSGDPDWTNDWQIKAAAKVMSLLFAANNVWQGTTRGVRDMQLPRAGDSPQVRARRSGQLIHTSGFYNTLLDYQDMVADFKMWETKRDKFTFCQYPLFLSMGTKIKILEYDARRQMEIKAREAYFDQVIRQRAIEGNFNLRIRRECMVDDSLRQISAAVGSGQEELKKGLRVHFQGEEGVDAGGPRKEWFLLLVRDIFDPNHGMFIYDEQSNTCYFNANSFETSDQYYLVGALLGLAIYNSTILDVAFPSFVFRKLLAAAPSSITNASNVASLTGTKGQMTYTLADLAEFRPSLAAGLQQLLDFEGDVEATYCRDFVVPIERYGTIADVPLIPNGANTPVTNANRDEFVDAYVRYLLDTAVSRQFEPFKRGFFTVCAGNALSLFRAEEIELLVRGSDEALDVDSLRAVAVYENWRHFQPPHQTIPPESVPIINWFWELFAEATPERQRKLLTFITGTDRIPAVGATSLILRIQAGGDGWGGGGRDERQRFPVARTCFNMLVLWRYDYREQLEEKLWRAVEESEGFGLK